MRRSMQAALGHNRVRAIKKPVPPGIPPSLWFHPLAGRASRVMVEARNHKAARKHFVALLARAKPARTVIRLRPRLFFTRAQYSGRYWVFPISGERKKR